ncbi:MAG: flavodoxin-dependent (E)-4-hydroxy-3-methylbut-2-enyl-diphosphate synthase [Eubacteriales bacterium]|nr:flavodoxin-dependent (E)-4-hydroxy-3-methylbut-2-enyl-diphosphate synthase [Eubacteriales bacterium]
MEKRTTRRIMVGNVPIGGDAPVSIQSMTNTDTRDIAATVRQINELAAAGADLVRLAVFDADAAAAIRAIRPRAAVPLVADIHFDYRLAIAAIENGIDKLRINPGNIGSDDRVGEVVRCASEHGIPIRVGVNGGSLDKRFSEKYPDKAEAMVESALYHVSLLEKHGFGDTVISVKCSDVPTMFRAYRMLAERTDYPLHLGVTEAGTERRALVKSAAGIGALLLNGIGDTIRVSITGDPVREVSAAKEILQSLGLRRGVDIVSCPTCGRNRVPTLPVVEEITRRTEGLNVPIRIAIMGCAVNGPGEAADADVGVAMGEGKGLLFAKGKKLRSVPAAEVTEALMALIEEFVRENGS